MQLSNHQESLQGFTKPVWAGMFFNNFIWISLLHLAGSIQLDMSLFKKLSPGEAVNGHPDGTLDCNGIAKGSIGCLMLVDCIAVLTDNITCQLVMGSGPGVETLYASQIKDLWKKQLQGPLTTTQTTTGTPTTNKDVQTTTQCGTLEFVGIGTNYKCTRVLSTNSGWNNSPNNPLITEQYCLEIATLEAECIDTVAYNPNNYMCFMYSCDGDVNQVQVIRNTAQQTWKLYSVFGKVPHDNFTY